jgi:large conductance mechanosensitive channel
MLGLARTASTRVAGGGGGGLDRTLNVLHFDELEGLERAGLSKCGEFYRQWKAFALKESAVDMAVGIMIGGAMTQIAGSLVTDVIMPLILWLDPDGGSLNNRYLLLHPGKNHTDGAGRWVCEGTEQQALMRTHTCYASLEEAQKDGALTLNHGKFLAVWFNFAVMTVFLMIAFKLADRVRRKAERMKEKALRETQADDAVGEDGFAIGEDGGFTGFTVHDSHEMDIDQVIAQHTDLCGHGYEQAFHDAQVDLTVSLDISPAELRELLPDAPIGHLIRIRQALAVAAAGPYIDPPL